MVNPDTTTRYFWYERRCLRFEVDCCQPFPSDGHQTFMNKLKEEMHNDNFTFCERMLMSLFRLGLFSVFQPILTMLWSGWCRFFLWFTVPLLFYPSLWESFQMLQLVLTWPSPACSSIFFKFFGKLQVFFYFRTVAHQDDKIHSSKNSFFLLMNTGFGHLAGISVSICF